MGLHDYGHLNAPQRIYYYITPHTKEYVNVCVRVCRYTYIAYVDAEGSWMPGIHLNNDLYVHNETQTHV